jgi:hypothetical protein
MPQQALSLDCFEDIENGGINEGMNERDNKVVKKELLNMSRDICYVRRSRHGPLKLRTVHFGDITIIYESKVCEQNIFPWLKGTIESRPRTKFQIHCSFK